MPISQRSMRVASWGLGVRHPKVKAYINTLFTIPLFSETNLTIFFWPDFAGLL